MKKFSFLSLPIIALLLIGAACSSDTTTNVTANTAATNAERAQTIAVTLLLNNGNASPVRSFSATVPAGTTALGLLQSVTTENDIALETKTSSFGTYVNGIGGLTANNTQYWLYYVNDKEATVGADSYTLQNGDTVEFRYGSGSAS